VLAQTSKHHLEISLLSNQRLEVSRREKKDPKISTYLNNRSNLEWVYMALLWQITNHKPNLQALRMLILLMAALEVVVKKIYPPNHQLVK
jgi:hypothetical protein